MFFCNEWFAKMKITRVLFLFIPQMIINALLLCFCEDRDLNDGSSERPYYGNKNLVVNIIFFLT